MVDCICKDCKKTFASFDLQPGEIIRTTDLILPDDVERPVDGERAVCLYCGSGNFYYSEKELVGFVHE